MTRLGIIYAIGFIIVACGLVFIAPRYYTQAREITRLRASNDSLVQAVFKPPMVDTVYLDTTIHVNVPVYYAVRDSVFIYDTLNVEVCRFLRTYRDTIPGDYLDLYYDLQTRGSLVGFDIWYDLRLPTIIKETPVVVLQPCPVHRKIGIWAETGSNLDGDIFLGGRVLYRNNYSGGYNYSPSTGTHLFTLGARLY